MSGHMGQVLVTTQNVEIAKVDVERGLIVVKGAVPGASDGYLFIKTPTRLYKRKARIQAGK